MKTSSVERNHRRNNFMKLNHEKVKKELRILKMRTADLARKWGISRQLAHHAINKGGLSYAERFALLFGCDRKDLIK